VIPACSSAVRSITGVVSDIHAHDPWLLIPVKSLGDGKSRLRQMWDAPARRALNEFLVRRMLRISSEFPGTHRTAVISACEDALLIAKSHGIHAIRQFSEPGLNCAAEEGLAALRGLGATDVLVLASDEPLVRPSDIRGLSERGARHREVLICPDKHNAGTNAIYLPGQASFRFQFGEGSCRKHFREALRAGLVPRLYLNKRIAFDIDTSADLRLWLQRYRTIG